MTRNGSMLHAAGSVVLETDSVIQQADEVDYNENTQELKAHGEVSVKFK